MQLPIEIQRAEILDWWETEHERISQVLPDRLPALYHGVDQAIDEMPVTAFYWRREFYADQIEPIVVEWIEKLHRELRHGLDESFHASSEAVEGKGSHDEWSYGEMATAGAAIAASVAPIAGIPFFAGGFTTAGITVFGLTFGGGALLLLPIVALVGSLVLFATGPAIRDTASNKLKAHFKGAVHDAIKMRVLGNPKDQNFRSLKDILLSELYSVTLKRIEMLG